MKPIDERKLQRLVDGELTRDEIRRVLEDARNSPIDWQRIALGFVENQTWDRAFNRRDNHQPTALDVPSSSDSNDALGKSSLPSASPPNRPRISSRLVMAATVLVATTIGYMAHQIQNRNLPRRSAQVENSSAQSPPQLAKNSIGNTRQASEREGRPQMTQADYHLELPEEQLGELASAGPVAPVPLFTVKNAEQWKRLNKQRNQSAISPEMLKQLTGSGYQMEQDINYISGRLVDGRSFVVPVRTIRFLPGQ